MCGIYGQINFNRPIDFNLSCKALNSLENRGPDAFGIYAGNYENNFYIQTSKEIENPLNKLNYFLGHRRLSIIDLNENATQPMISKDGNYIITFNGEIFNYIELREELFETGCNFVTDHSDTEVLLIAYITWGKKLLKKIRGQFSFAIYDKINDILFFARDRIGQKPFYYSMLDGGFIFSSELTSIVKFEKRKFLVNLDSLNNYLKYGYIPAPDTFFQNVSKLLPAYYGIYDIKTNKLNTYQYWDIENRINYDLSEEKSLKDVKKTIKESVELRLRSDVPLGAFISGGIDSTVIIKTIADIFNDKLDVYGADFPQPERSERVFIEKASQTYNTNLTCLMINEDSYENLDKLISIFDEPFDGGSSIALYELFEKIKGKKKVILTGDGGDEIFAGYERYKKFLKFNKGFKYIRIIRFFYYFYKILFRLGIFIGKMKNLIDVSESTSPLNLYLSIMYSGILTELMLSKPIINNNNIFLKKIERIKDPIKQIQLLELKTILPGRMLYKLDRISMFFSIEARSPLLDHKLIEKAFTIPSNYMIDSNKTKKILKKILKENFDDRFIERTKKGFGNPISHWFKKIEQKQILSVLNNDDSVIFKFINFNKLHKMFPQIKTNSVHKDYTYIWRLIVLAMYLKNYESYILFDLENN